MSTHHKPTILFCIGVIFAPAIIGWFLLDKAYDKKFRIFGITWMIFGMVVVSTGGIMSDYLQKSDNIGNYSQGVATIAIVSPMISLIFLILAADLGKNLWLPSHQENIPSKFMFRSFGFWMLPVYMFLSYLISDDLNERNISKIIGFFVFSFIITFCLYIAGLFKNKQLSEF